MMEMVNGSRFGVAMMGLGIARRCFLEAAIWAHHRQAKGRLLVDLPLVASSSSTCSSISKPPWRSASSARRVTTGRRRSPAPHPRPRRQGPAVPLRGRGRQRSPIELHGGNGYCEDWGLTRQLRDAQCHPIWEGSENICALDVLRAIRRDAAHESVFTACRGSGSDRRAIKRPRSSSLQPTPSNRAVPHSRAGSTRRWRSNVTRPKPRSAALAGQLVRMVCRRAAARAVRRRSPQRPGRLALPRRHLIPESEWTDGIAAVAGRELLAYDEIDEPAAAKAAA